jgi:hypothetical protein
VNHGAVRPLLRRDEEVLRMTTWVAIVTSAMIAFSFAFACATPLAAVAAFAGSRMSRRDGPTLIIAAWLANQLIGYLVLDYPRTWDSYAWGATIGAASLLAGIAAAGAARTVRQWWLSPYAAFVAAFSVYEGALFAATVVLPSCAGAFSPSVIARILAINAGAMVGLMAIHSLAAFVGLEPHAAPQRTAFTQS